MKVEDVMSENLVVGYVPGTVKDALKILAKNNVSGMPILKKDTKMVVGVLTRTDIFRNPDEDQLALLMSDNFYYVERDQSIKEAAKLLYEKRIHGLPVINNRKHLVGIVSPTDILKSLNKNIDKKIEDCFTNIVVPVYQDTPINIIMEIINVTHENALPVLNDERKICGIVTDGDLFKLSHIRESVSETDFGLIILDWNLPNMTGIEFIKEFRTEKKWEDVPVVMVTSEAEKRYLLAAIEAGVTSYVAKPVTPEVFWEKISQYIK